ncbi:39566_t:CDS:1, partial [Gigaspora margarita]
NATLFEIKQAYKKFVLVYYPNRNINKSENECLEAEKKFKEIQEAYEYLTTNYKEPKKRKPSQPKKKNSNSKKQSHKKNKKTTFKKTESKQEIKIGKEFKE